MIEYHQTRRGVMIRGVPYFPTMIGASNTVHLASGGYALESKQIISKCGVFGRFKRVLLPSQDSDYCKRCLPANSRLLGVIL